MEAKIADAPRPLLEELTQVELSEAISSEDFFVSVKQAAKAFENRHRGVGLGFEELAVAGASGNPAPEPRSH